MLCLCRFLVSYAVQKDLSVPGFSLHPCPWGELHLWRVPPRQTCCSALRGLFCASVNALHLKTHGLLSLENCVYSGFSCLLWLPRKRRHPTHGSVLIEGIKQSIAKLCYFSIFYYINRKEKNSKKKNHNEMTKSHYESLFLCYTTTNVLCSFYTIHIIHWMNGDILSLKNLLCIERNCIKLLL